MDSSYRQYIRRCTPKQILTFSYRCMRTYFASLGDSAHPHSDDPQLRQVTKFQELLVVAFREFGIITDELINNERKRFRSDVVESIENFAKRAQLRNLKFSGRFDKVQLGRIFDNFQLGILKCKEAKEKAAQAAGMLKSPSSATTASASVQHVDEDDRPEIRIDRETFGYLLAEVATWAADTFIVKMGFHETKQIKVAEHELIGENGHPFLRAGLADRLHCLQIGCSSHGTRMQRARCPSRM